MSASVVILTDDPKLRDECVTALRSLGDDEPRHRFVANTNQLFEALRTQSVELVLAEFTTQPKELNALARQVATASADTAFAAILRPEGFPESVSESAVLIDAMRCGVCDFLRRPISTADLRRLLQARSDNALSHPSATPKHGRVVTFISNKGGVGKSTLSTNVAVAAARYKKLRVLLIDGSLQMGVAAALLDLRPSATLTDLARESERLDATMIRQSAAVHSSGLHLLAAPADAVEAMEVDDLLMARVINLARQSYDLVIVDTFPMFDRVVIAALDLSDRVYVILENVVPTLLGGVKLIDVLQRIGYPAEKQSVVINRYQRIPGGLALGEVAERLARPIEHVLPFDKRVMIAANSGAPIALSPLRFSGFSRALDRLVVDVVGSAKPVQRANAESDASRLNSSQDSGSDESLPTTVNGNGVDAPALWGDRS